MARRPKNLPLMISEADRRRLEEVATSRTESAARVERARTLLAWAPERSFAAIASLAETTGRKSQVCVEKALRYGPIAALNDLPRKGRTATITLEARSWIVSLACQKPKDLGYASELWTTKELAAHAREHCVAAGHPSLMKLRRGTVSKILRKNDVRPHKIVYYLERRDPEFETKMAEVLCVYKEVQLVRAGVQTDPTLASVVSYDEKPGIQAIENMAPDLPPVPGTHPTIARDHEYIRHGTVSLMAGIDLLTGHVHGNVVDRHRSAEFVEFLKTLDDYYPTGKRIRVILDNHSAHISRETGRFLAAVPNRFDFVFTPKHGSWLNLIESFFGKMARTLLRGIRVSSKEELKDRIRRWLDEINQMPVVFRWKYGITAAL